MSLLGSRKSKATVVCVKNLSGVVDLVGVRKKNGRKLKAQDLTFKKGPLDCSFNLESKEILSISKTNTSKKQTSGVIEWDGTGLWATPGFFDSHTHTLFSGHRSSEFFKRFKGETYQEIAAAGGGIHNTHKATLGMIESDPLNFSNVLESQVKKQFDKGISVVEFKTGYAPTADGELKLLRFLKNFRKNLPTENYPKILVTFLPLHALPKGKPESHFVDEMISILPIVKKEGLADFADAFPERGFFSLEESLRFASSAQKIGLGLKIHADELSDLGTSAAFAHKKALSVDHLQKISVEGVAALSNSKTVACLLPATSFFLGLDYANARKLLNSGAQVALATDFNPGTAPELGMNLTMRLAASQMKMDSWEIFAAATFNGAAALGLSESMGTLEPGQRTPLKYWKSSAANATELFEEIIIMNLDPITYQNSK